MGLFSSTPRKGMKTRFARLRLKNMTYRGQIEDYLQTNPSEIKKKRASKAREMYFKKLGESKFFKKLLSKRETVTIKVNNKPLTFTILKTIIIPKESGVKSVVVLDERGQSMIFFKSKEKDLLGKSFWRPLKGIAREVNGKNVYWVYAKQEGSHIMEETNDLLRLEIARREKSMKLIEDCSIKKLQQIKRFL